MCNHTGRRSPEVDISSAKYHLRLGMKDGGANVIESTVSGLRVFLSYSNKDGSALTDQLSAAITAVGHIPIRDRLDLVPGEVWQNQLAALLQNADAILIVVTPGWLSSEVGRWEVTTADILHKHCVPVIVGGIAELEVPPEIITKHCIDFSAERFGEGLANIIKGLSLNNDWLRQHTELGIRAEAWINSDRSKSLLLDKPALRVANTWASARPYYLPGPTSNQQEFLQASARRHRGFW